MCRVIGIGLLFLGNPYTTKEGEARIPAPLFVLKNGKPLLLKKVLQFIFHIFFPFTYSTGR
ncbi:hypothetical protein DX928_16400 [Bacillus swezeyi]|uniref:Uncharacterized protein n=1 Tax=Bacillus swezeyi TaxID=1925020 RepID=A0A5M8RMT4_9BACI|nr:hypothetical protein DX927_16090 [Bacillus swezeyi]KAA6474191.1 hypothetical protein DX928_16400 [Bacillus swezeyi]